MLDGTWEGPFEEVEQISPVTYKLAVPKYPKRSSVLHINMLRPWKNPEAQVLRVEVADEDHKEERDSKPLQPYGADFSSTQMKEVDFILAKFQNGGTGRAWESQVVRTHYLYG